MSKTIKLRYIAGQRLSRALPACDYPDKPKITPKKGVYATIETDLLIKALILADYSGIIKICLYIVFGLCG